MYIAIVDDEARQRGILISYIKEHFSAVGGSYSVEEFDSGESFLAAAATKRFRLVFMDIYMGGASGVETAAAFRRTDGDCPLVFTTTSTDHALDAYRLRAMQYLVKPYDPKEIERLFEELERRLPPPDSFIEIPDGRQSVRIRHRDILWAENHKHQVHVHLEDGSTVSSRITFADFAALVRDERRFFVCGRGVLVNLTKAQDFDGRCFLLPQAQIPVSRQLAADARAAFARWLFEKDRGGVR